MSLSKVAIMSLLASSSTSSAPPSASVAQAPGGKVLFTRIGETALVSASHIAKLDFDLEKIERLATQVRRAIRETEEYGKGTGGRIHQNQRWKVPVLGEQAYAIGALLRSLETSAIRCKRLRSLFHGQDEIHHLFLAANSDEQLRFNAIMHRAASRPKRAIFTGIILGIIAATTAFISGYLIYKEVSAIKSRVDDLAELTSDTGETLLRVGSTEKEMAELVQDSLAVITGQHRSLEGIFAARGAADAIERRVSLIEETLTAAADGRLATVALLQLDFEKALHEVRISAAQWNMAPVSKFITDWLSFPVSWIATPTGFELYIQVPLIDLSAQLAIYQFHPLPIPLTRDLHLTVSPVGFTYVAVDPEHKLYRALSAADLQLCRRTGTYFACDLAGVARKTSAPITAIDSERCLYELFAGNIENIVKCCPSQLASRTAAITPTAPHSFASYSANPVRARVHCPNQGVSHQFITLHDVSLISLPPSCTAETDEYFIASSDRIFQRADHAWAVDYDWPSDPKKWFEPYDQSAMDDLLHRAAVLANHTEALNTQTVLHKHKVDALLDSSMLHASAVPAIGTVSTLFIGSWIIIIFLGWWFYRKLAARERALYNHVNYELARPIAPPAQGPVNINMSAPHPAVTWKA